jgi:4-amino-4-deoxy-L-arabinose transferase-like glycosyltransferase
MILGAIFKLLGVYSRASAWAILCLDSLLNALMIPLIWETARRCFNQRVALWSAWIWALYPAAMQYAVKWVWEMTLTAFLFQLALVLALRIGNVGEEREAGNGQSWKNWLGFGAVWGLIALSNPSPLLFLPLCGVWMLARSGRVWMRHLPKAFAAGVLFCALIAPWVFRNWQVLHAFIPLRSNFGVELYLGNGPGAQGFLMEYNHPSKDARQLALYHQMGEIRYSAWRGGEAKAAIQADRWLFLRNTLKRIYFFWFGVPNPQGHPAADFFRSLNYGFASLSGLMGLFLMLCRRKTAAVLFAGALLLMPASYYMVTVHARFRHPLEPMILILSVYLFEQARPVWGFTWPGLHRLWPARAKCTEEGANCAAG